MGRAGVLAAFGAALLLGGPAWGQDPQSQFGGFYFGAGGSYGISQPQPFGIYDGISSFNGTSHPQGWSGIAAGGYNMQAGHFLLGLELAGRFGREWDGATRTDSYLTSGIAGQTTKSHEFNSDAGANLSLRVGVIAGPALLFGKIGLGAAHTEETSISQATGANCLGTSFQNGQFVCTFTAPLISSETKTANWLPSFILGLGGEYNVGRLFGRVAIEGEAIRGPSGNNELFWVGRGQGMVGFRF